MTSNPATKRFKSDKDVYGTAADFPIVCTTYRLTEMYHYWTKHIDRLNQLQPGFFIEIPEELAKEKGIANGGRSRVTSARGSIEGVAMVTKRLRPMQVDGKPLWQIGFPIHWGYDGDGGPHRSAGELPDAVGDGSEHVDARVQDLPGQAREGVKEEAR